MDVSPREAFGASRMHHSQKEEVIAYLAACDLEPPARRKLFKAWCRATNSQIRREDVARVAPGKPREVQLGLL